MIERPTGVPLTADNVADAVECRDSDGVTAERVRRRANRPETWRIVVDGCTTCYLTDSQMVSDTRTVVTKWRKP